MGNFLIALSGLEADSVELNTIGNNLANLNTTAYKGQTTSFEDLFYQQIEQSGQKIQYRSEAERKSLEPTRISVKGRSFQIRRRIRAIWH